jgi:preprotein translocase subunit SecA
MDVRDGRIHDAASVSAMGEGDRQYMVPMAYPPTPYQRQKGRVGRNDPCPCGSGKKFKRCHLFRTRQA